MPANFPTYLVTFLSLTAIQILSSRRLQATIFQLVLTITHNHKLAVIAISILFLPGTIIHELSHLLVAKALFVHTGDIDVLPSFSEGDDKIKMGSAEIGQTDPIRRSLIGVAPIIVGISLVVVLVWLFGGSLDFRQTTFVWWQALLLLYFTFVIGNTFVSSNKDLEGVGGVIVTAVSVLLIVCLILYLTGNLTSQSLLQIYQYFYSQKIQVVLFQASLAMLIPLIINLTFLGAFKIFKK